MPPGSSGPPDDSRNARRKRTRQHLAELFADIPPKRRAAFMRRAGNVLTKILEEADPEDTKYDGSGKILRLGTSKRDRAAIVKDALSSFKLLGEISRDATEQHIAVTKLIHGILAPTAPQSPTIQIVYPAGTPPAAPTLITAHNDDPEDSSKPPPSGGA